MLEIYQFGDDLDELNRKRRELEYAGYKFERDAEDTPQGQTIADEKKAELIKTGFDVVILKTRGLIDMWSRKQTSETED